MNLGIIGAGGHGKVIGDTAYSAGYKNIFYFDSFIKKINFKLHGKFIGKLDKIYKYKDLKFIVALGDNNKRYQIFKNLEINNFKIATIIHPTASVSKLSYLGKGSVVMPNAVININTKIAKGCIINTGSTIDHDCSIKKFTHICPGVNIAGNVKIGEFSLVGIGSKIIPNIIIGSKVTIGAGSIILKNIKSNNIVYNNQSLIINDKK